MMSTVRKLFWFGGFGLIVVAAWATGIHWQLFLAPLLIGVGLGPVVFSGRFQLEGGIVTILSLWVLGAIGFVLPPCTSSGFRVLRGLDLVLEAQRLA